MKPNDLSKSTEAFNRAVDYAIRECSRKTGVTDLETVYRFVRRSASVVVKRLRVLLADQQLRVLIQKRLKRCTVSLQEAQATAFRERQQLHFDFWDLEPFRRMRVHQRITYPNGKLVEYVEYNRSLEWQRLRSIEHLRRGIDADTAQCDAEVAANDFLHRLVERHGDLPAEKLAELWLQEQDGEETANA